MAGSPVRFPIAEGFGIFVAIAAADVLIAGEVNLFKASLIAAGAAIVLYLARRRLLANRRRHLH
ncbi:hypothetical protein [Accumulibacter sp.]|uniref:hypothetical protein n=1 Tax=Accumulibacter sp. TaxID=2053492 RepID=UPI00262F5003|nr:hypothetical protein [Accumulibacter sp.]